MNQVPEEVKDIASHAAAQLVVRATLFREAFGRDAAVAAGCVDDVLTLLAAYGLGLTDEGKAEIAAYILGHDETDDILADTAAVSA
jgi:hypothetical protein